MFLNLIIVLVLIYKIFRSRFHMYHTCGGGLEVTVTQKFYLLIAEEKWFKALPWFINYFLSLVKPFEG